MSKGAFFQMDKYVAIKWRIIDIPPKKGSDWGTAPAYTFMPKLIEELLYMPAFISKTSLSKGGY